ncbi:MAG: class I SAM-dependent methyltransferase [Planctomycetota bacterium]
MAGASDASATNRLSWDARVPVHTGSDYYRAHIDQLRRRDPVGVLPGWIERELPPVEGKSLLHLQCHLGTDTVALGLMGAKVTGLDFSEPAIAFARQLAHDAGVDASFIQADATRASDALPDTAFDIVFASIGVFCWIEDITAWFTSAATLIKPGGTLYIADDHPFVNALTDTAQGDLNAVPGYFSKDPLYEGEGGTYADDGTNAKVPPSVEYNHTIGEFVTTIASAGLVIDFLHEHPGCSYKRYEAMTKTPEGRWALPADLDLHIPMNFSLRARKPPIR